MRVLAGVALAFVVACGIPAPAAEPPAEPGLLPIQFRGAVSGTRQRIAFFDQLNPDCTSDGAPVVHVLLAPQHGTLQAIGADSYSYVPPGSQNYACNLHKTPGTVLSYTSSAGFQGNDALAVSVIYPHGFRYVLRYVVTVEPGAATSPPQVGWQHV